jgi:bacillolysin
MSQRLLLLTFSLLAALVARAETIHLRPDQALEASDANIAGLVFKDQARTALGPGAAPGTGAVDALRLTTSSEGPKASRYQRYQQYYKGLKVYGKQVVVRADQDLTVRSVTGNIEQGLSLSTDPALPGPEAMDKALAEAAEVKLFSAPELLVYMHEGQPRLAYMAVVQFTDKDGAHLGKLFVDADSGRRLSFKTHLHNGLERRIYDLEHKCVQSPGDLPGTFRFGETPSDDADDAELAAFTNAGISYWFYRHLFGRDSFDGAGAALVASVHAEFPADFQNPFNPCSKTHSNNAFFAGEPVYQMIYGDGDGEDLAMPSAALDIVAHELSHGVTFTTSDLDYENESGALNEAFSDIMGATASAWHASGGSEQGNPPNGIQATAATWEMGETASPNGRLMRYMDDPVKDGRSKDNYDDRIKLGAGEQPGESNDYGGVHFNSGIVNLAFYLLAEGGSHPRDATEVQVAGIGIEPAAQVFYQANTQYFGATTDFEEARYALADSADVLYGDCSAAWRGVHTALDAVKVPGDWDAAHCDHPGGGEQPGGDDGQPPSTEIETPRVSASSTYAAQYPPGLTVDGDRNSYWVSRVIPRWQSGYEYLIFDWQLEQHIAELEVHFYDDAYKGQVHTFYSDGERWQPLTGSADTRRIAVLLTGRPTRSVFAVREVELR